jgi:ketosteroid isomerase-like protein
MSRENVEIVRRVYDAAMRRDTATLVDLYDPEFEWDTSRDAYWGPLVGRGIYRGHDGLRRWFRELNEAWDSIEFFADELIEVGDKVISVNTGRGRGRRSGIDVEGTNAGVWTIRGGKILRVVWFTTREEALEFATAR